MEDGAEAGKEKLVLSQECHLVTLMSVVKGRFDITTTHVYFHDLSPVKEDMDRQDFKVCTVIKYQIETPLVRVLFQKYVNSEETF